MPLTEAGKYFCLPCAHGHEIVVIFFEGSFCPRCGKRAQSTLCRHCEKVVSWYDDHCQYCGRSTDAGLFHEQNKLEAAEKIKQDREKEKTRIIVVVCSFVLFLLLIKSC